MSFLKTQDRAVPNEMLLMGGDLLEEIAYYDIFECLLGA